MRWFSSPLHNHTLTFELTTGGTGDGDGVPASSPRPALVVEGCNVQPRSAVQTSDGGVQTTTSYRASLPGVGYAIPAGTSVTWPGHPGPWWVEADPLEYTGTGDLDHTELTLTSIGG